MWYVMICVGSHIGAQIAMSAPPPTAELSPRHQEVPVYHLKYAELTAKVEAGRECKRRFVGGVMPDVVVRHWKTLGYSVRTGAKVGGRW